MPICFQCSHCGRRLSTATRKAGQAVVCPGCAREVVVPAVRLPVFTGVAGDQLFGRRLTLACTIAGLLLGAVVLSASPGVAEPEEPEQRASVRPSEIEGANAKAMLQSADALMLSRFDAEEVDKLKVVLPREEVAVDAAPPIAAVEPIAPASAGPSIGASPIVVFVPIVVGEPARAAPEPPAPPDPSAKVAVQPPAAGACGTGIDFARTPQVAAEQAKKERKLVMLLHISGNFEDARFT
jgi:hypothetical protein